MQTVPEFPELACQNFRNPHSWTLMDQWGFGGRRRCERRLIGEVSTYFLKWIYLNSGVETGTETQA
jgi:hypothetical protein